MIFSEVSILGVDQRSEFLGEGVGRIRSVKTFNIEGYLYSDGTIGTPQEYVSDFLESVSKEDGALSGGHNVEEDITINGVNYGKGKLASFDFQAGPEFDASQINLGKYAATIEFYLTPGSATSFYNALDAAGPGGVRPVEFQSPNLPPEKYLESFGESYNFSLSEDNNYEYSHNVNITYMSGQGRDPIADAQLLANTLFDQTLYTFSGDVVGHWGTYRDDAQARYSETYNKQTYECSFDKKVTLFPNSGDISVNGVMRPYSSNITNTYNLNELGIATVRERGMVSSLNRKYSAAAGIDAEIEKSYERCSGIYDQYKESDGLHPIGHQGVLYKTVNTLTKTINNINGSMEYDLQYTDDQAFENPLYKVDRVLTYNQAGNTKEVSEQGTISSYHTKQKKGGIYNRDMVADFLLYIPRAVDAQLRILNFYLKSGGDGIIKLNRSHFELPKYGKSAQYSYSFTDDEQILDTGDFTKKQIRTTDTPGIIKYKNYQIPNAGDVLVHTPGQTNTGVRIVNATCVMRRKEGINNIQDLVDTGDGMNFADQLTDLKNELLAKAYEVFVDHPYLRTLDASVIRLINATYDFDSDNNLNMSIEVQYILERDRAGDDMLLFK
jgi:hypothetical protein